MTGRQKIEAAFSKEGTSEIGAVICYEDIFIRDHWKELTDLPWWYRESPYIEQQLLWRREIISQIGQDWFFVPSFHSRSERQNLSLEILPEGVFITDKRTGNKKQLWEPKIGGWSVFGGPHSIHPLKLPESQRELDMAISFPANFSAEKISSEGSGDLAELLHTEFGNDFFPVYHIASPFWSLYDILGFEEMMKMVMDQPELVKYACERFLVLRLESVQKAAALGAAGIWIEECLTDMISPASFASLNLPFLRRIIEKIRATGMKSIYYFCGNPTGKWEQILSAGADALAFEESKKGFTIDIEDVAEKMKGRCVLLGNLDAVGILQNGTEEKLKKEIIRQVVAGRKNKSRFIMSLGSPVTAHTSVNRVRMYCELVHEIGK